MRASLFDYPRLAQWAGGVNESVEVAMFRRGESGPEILLAVRGCDTPFCPAMPSLLAGFVERGEAHVNAASRVAALAGLGRSYVLREMGVFTEPGRHPFNSDSSFVRANAYAGWVAGSTESSSALDDLRPGDVAWVALQDLQRQTMAFDHGAILSRCCEKFALEDPCAGSYATESPWSKVGFDRQYDPAAELEGRALEYAHGSCAELAIALNSLTDYPIRAAVVEDESDGERTLIHAWVEMSDGLALDAHGILRQDELLARYEDAGYAGVHEYSKESLLSLLRRKSIPSGRLNQAKIFAGTLLEQVCDTENGDRDQDQCEVPR